MTVRPRRIGHIGLVARDLARMVAFYEETLGMLVSDRMPYPEDSLFDEAVWLRIDTDHHVLSMFGLRDGGEPNGSDRAPRPGMHHVAFEMESFEDLRRIARNVREEGIPLQGMRTGGPGCRAAAVLLGPRGQPDRALLGARPDRLGRRDAPVPAGREHRPRGLRRRCLARVEGTGVQAGRGPGERRGDRVVMSDQALFEGGLEKRRAVVGSEYVERALGAVDDFDRDWQRLLTEYCWGEIWTGSALSDRQRSLHNLCLLAALNRQQEFELHFRGALRNGCTLDELRETLTQIAVYVGVPAGVEAFRIAKRVLAEQAP